MRNPLPRGDPTIVDRRFPRKSVRIEATLRVLSVQYRVVLLDLSASGYRIECIHRMGAGQRALLRLDSFEPMGGSIVWVDGNTAGCVFDRPLHPSVAETIAARYPGLSA